MGTERLVRVLQSLLVALDRWYVRSESALDGSFELTVNIGLWQIRLLDNVVLAVGSLLRLR